MGNHTQSAEGGAYTARARRRSAARRTAATAAPAPPPPAAEATRHPPRHPQEIPATGGAPLSSAPAKPASPRQPVASSAALAFHRANRPAGSTLNTVGPGLYRLSMPGMVPRVVSGQELNAAFRAASRADRHAMRAGAREMARTLHPAQGHSSSGHQQHGNIGREAVHLYHQILHTLGRAMGH